MTPLGTVVVDEVHVFLLRDIYLEDGKVIYYADRWGPFDSVPTRDRQIVLYDPSGKEVWHGRFANAGWGAIPAGVMLTLAIPTIVTEVIVCESASPW